MAGNFNLKAIISAVDKLSPTLRNIQKGAKLTRKTLKDIGSAYGNLRNELGIPVTLFGAASVGGIATAVKNFAEYGSVFNDTAIKTGGATKALQEYAYAAKLSGVQQESLFGGLTKLNKAIAEAAAGKNKQVVTLFRKLGISLRDANGHLVDAGQTLPQIADAIAKIQDPAVRTRVAMALFGKSGADLIPLLAEGAGGLKSMAEEARKLGLVLTSDEIQDADRLGDNFDKIRAAGQGLSNTIGARLAPVLNPMIERFIEWYKINRLIIGQKIADVVTSFAVALEKVNWGEFFKGVEAFFASISSIAETVGGWKNLLIAFVLIANAGVAAALIQIAVSLYSLGAAFVVAAKAAALFLFANPLLLAMLISLGVFAGLAYKIYSNWDGIADWFSNMLLGIRDAFVQAFAVISELFLNLTPMGAIIKNWEPISTYFEGLVNRITGFFTRIPDALSNAVSMVGSYLPDWFADAPAPALAGMGGGGSLLASGALSQAAGVAPRAGGEINVSFANAPTGMRVDTTRAPGANVGVNTSVGYNSRAMGMP